MKNKRVKKDSEEDEEEIIRVPVKKKTRGVSNADLLKTKKLKIQKKLSGFSHEKDVDLLADIPSTAVSVYKSSNQIQEVDLYKDYTDKIMHERTVERQKFILELEKKFKNP
jgi:hypothetical protein